MRERGLLKNTTTKSENKFLIYYFNKIHISAELERIKQINSSETFQCTESNFSEDMQITLCFSTLQEK